MSEREGSAGASKCFGPPNSTFGDDPFVPSGSLALFGLAVMSALTNTHDPAEVLRIDDNDRLRELRNHSRFR
jgi:hypothetical protein